MCTHCVSLAATVDEIQKLELIQAYHRRRSKSDAVRFLIENEAEKILQRNVPDDTRNVNGGHSHDLENA